MIAATHCGPIRMHVRGTPIMDKKTFFAAVAEILEVDGSGWVGTERLCDVGNWDSLSVISFVAMVDSDLNQIVDAEKLKNAKTLDDLAALVGL